MRARDAVTVFSLASMALGFGAGIGACFDLFHSTGNVLTACEVAPSTPGCSPEGGPAVTPDAGGVCASTAAIARQEADRACAWLGACETPMGGNAFGPCSLQARLAYDCAANPAHRVAGKAFTFWHCMLGVKTCSDVGACVFSGTPESCSDAGPPLSCSDSGDVVVSCSAGGAAAVGENCSMRGLACGVGGPAGAECVGPTGFSCTVPVCDQITGAIELCSGPAPSEDIGIQCADNGGQGCDVFPSHDAGQWAACIVGESPDASIACAANTAVACENGVATSCPAGVVETIDCATILENEKGCASVALSPQFDWTAPCVVSPPECSADRCDDAGAVLTGCARGSPLSVGCAEAGLGPCVAVNGVDLDAGPGSSAACGQP